MIGISSVLSKASSLHLFFPQNCQLLHDDDAAAATAVDQMNSNGLTNVLTIFSGKMSCCRMLVAILSELFSLVFEAFYLLLINWKFLGPFLTFQHLHVA